VAGSQGALCWVARLLVVLLRSHKKKKGRGRERKEEKGKEEREKKKRIKKERSNLDLTPQMTSRFVLCPRFSA
jgi:hypothetical protein